MKPAAKESQDHCFEMYGELQVGLHHRADCQMTELTFHLQGTSYKLSLNCMGQAFTIKIGNDAGSH